MFDTDTYPGKPRILFVGIPFSTHAHAWIDLLSGTELNVRFFGLPLGCPPSTWGVRTYVTAQDLPEGLDPETRQCLYPTPEELKAKARVVRWAGRGLDAARRTLSQSIGRPPFAPLWFRRAFGPQPRAASPPRWLAQVLQDWRPDVVHTLGIDPASYFFRDVARALPDLPPLKWVVQARGGPDLALHRLVPQHRERIREVLTSCDQFIADNRDNYHYAMEMGLESGKQSALGVVPGTGGIDAVGLSRRWQGRPSKRGRIIVWPKSYECPQSKALPVLEALKAVWDRIQPCEVYALTMPPDVQLWYWTLPEAMRRCIHTSEGIPRVEVLELLARSRVMLAPSLSDGVPNSLYEAMACGAFPIVSPLETITAVVREEENALFARNLYVAEIADALLRAMRDDDLVDRAAENNRRLVGEIADRATIRPKVIAYYSSLLA